MLACVCVYVYVCLLLVCRVVDVGDMYKEIVLCCNIVVVHTTRGEGGVIYLSSLCRYVECAC